MGEVLKGSIMSFKAHCPTEDQRIPAYWNGGSGSNRTDPWLLRNAVSFDWRTHRCVVPDFDHVILEGTLKIRGNITLFQAVRIACTIYFDKDLQKLIRLLKREVA